MKPMNRQTFSFVHRPRVRLGALAVLVLLVGVAVGWTASDTAVKAAPAPPAAAPVAGPAPSGRAVPCRGQDSYADLVSQVAPAVVTIRSERLVKTAASPFNDDMFDQFFGAEPRRQRPPETREQGALGSGVIVSPDGYILTNHHVVAGASRIRVELSDRRSFDAKLVGSDEPSDLAVLKIPATGLRSLPLGNSDKARVGDVVLAIGNPLGVGQTVTMGIISAKGRATGLDNNSYEDFLQTDAPINQGNSGGALVDTSGELIGINSQILTPSGGNIGIGFAIPAAMAQNVMTQLIKNGVVHRAVLGVTVQPVTSDLAKSLGLEDVKGALVAAVEPDSPAQHAGLERGDVILTFDGTPVTDSNSLRNLVANSQPGTMARLTILRNGKKETKEATLAERPTQQRASNTGGTEPESGRYGLSVSPVTPDVARELGVRPGRGLVVEEVAPASAASDAGIEPGDVIVEVDHHPVNSSTQFREAMSAETGRPALLLVNRQGSDIFVALSPRRG
jgi:Do/DeqQ family serine protease